MYARAYVEITNICNMNCSFCHGHSRTPGKMDKTQFAHILEQLQGQTQYIYYHLMGEPLLHPQLGEFLQMAASAGFRSVLTTNGTLLNKLGHTLLQAEVWKISISLHSFEQNDEESYRRYLSGVAEFADRAVKAGTIVNFRLWNRGMDGGRNETALAFLREYFCQPWTENTRGYRLQDKLFLEWGDRFVWPDMGNPSGTEAMTCYGLRDQFGILCDGTVVPCCLDSDGVMALGNVFSQPLAEILESPRAKAIVEGFRNRRVSEQLCLRCPYARRFG